MQKRIYLETTIPSSYHTLRTDEESLVKQRVTRQWWHEYAELFTFPEPSAEKPASTESTRGEAAD